jgi:hypothetical protein
MDKLKEAEEEILLLPSTLSGSEITDQGSRRLG